VTTHTSHPQGATAQISGDHAAPVVLVTGGAGGIGDATLQRFIAGGWRTASVDLQPSQVGGVVNVITDVRRVDQCRAAVEHVVASLGRLDAVVNAAGVWHEGDTATTSEDDFDRVIDVNLKGTYFVSAAALAHLERSRGCIINLSSDAGLQGNSGAAAYCASKGGVSLFTKALALEVAPRGVRVNAVCPGDVDSPMLRGQAHNYGGGEREYYDRLLAGYPQREHARFITPSEVAELIWFLAQPAAAPITGANLSIDFGLSAGIFP
jgi:NAD(P)-dependent dehydrogenase (short-subunit alcohol dehydrogenase family)